MEKSNAGASFCKYYLLEITPLRRGLVNKTERCSVQCLRTECWRSSLFTISNRCIESGMLCCCLLQSLCVSLRANFDHRFLFFSTCSGIQRSTASSAINPAAISAIAGSDGLPESEPFCQLERKLKATRHHSGLQALPPGRLLLL